MKKEKIEAILTASEYIDRLIEGIKKASEDIYDNKENQGILLLPQIIEGIEYIFKIIELTRDLLGNIEEDKEMLLYLKEIIEGMENEDYILVADIYMYEITPLLKNIKTIFVKVATN